MIYRLFTIDRVRKIVLIFALLIETKLCWDGSSVGRAEDWKSSCRRFDSVPSHHHKPFINWHLQIFCGYLFYFSSAEYNCNKSKRSPVSSFCGKSVGNQSEAVAHFEFLWKISRKSKWKQSDPRTAENAWGSGSALVSGSEPAGVRERTS